MNCNWCYNICKEQSFRTIKHFYPARDKKTKKFIYDYEHIEEKKFYCSECEISFLQIITSTKNKF